MTNINIVSFNSGEVTPEIDARKDIAKYTGGCRRLENMIPDLYGNATKRPGTEMIVVGNGAACYFEGPVADPAKTQIYNAEELALIGNDVDYPLNGDYEVMSNIDLDGITFKPIGLVGTSGTRFNGTFDGNYFTISNLTIDDTVLTGGGGSDVTGFFWGLNGATVENLTISNMLVSGGSSTRFSGGLLTHTSTGGTIVTNVHTQGTMIGDSADQIGGMFSSSNADVSLCSADATLSSGRDFFSAGGLTVFFGGNMENCYAQGSIISTYSGAAIYNTGGLIGDHGGGASQTVTNCYSAISISGTESTAIPNKLGGISGAESASVTFTYSSVYWDGDLIGNPPGALDDTGTDGDVAGITESTTSDMYTQTYYSGWDFSTIWIIDEGTDYPRLLWELQSDKKKVCQQI